MAASTSPASSNRLIWRLTSRDWQDEEDVTEQGVDGGDEGEEEEAAKSSIRFSDLAKSSTSASRDSQFTDVDSIAVRRQGSSEARLGCDCHDKREIESFSSFFFRKGNFFFFGEKKRKERADREAATSGKQRSIRRIKWSKVARKIGGLGSSWVCTNKFNWPRIYYLTNLVKK